MTAEIAAILVTDAVAPARPLVDALLAQTAASRLEVVVVAPQGELEQTVALFIDGGFAAVRAVACDVRRHGLAAARCAGIRAAHAPVVVFTETHCFPEPGWARALIAAHAAGPAVVGPVFRNGNPATRSSTSGFLAHYGTFAAPPPPPPYTDLPGHNSSYSRDLLLALGGELTELLKLEYVLHGRLRAAGHELLLAEDAVCHHFNVSRRRAGLRAGYLAGRLFAPARAADWSRARRGAYALAWPLITALRVRRHAGDARRIGLRLTPGLVAVLIVRLVFTSVGEAVGYVAGEGGAQAPLFDMELRRDRYLAGREPEERAMLEAIAR
ncbi:unannotated protein [freshwater metagenome]|uniref:Unannotated protein n=1 Tax=freshwater metagenome TaxID=449393 RepID=A0A6J7GYJ9_9ZZZZ|nr:glycosyltransferase [Actinomycetota bacterium]